MSETKNSGGSNRVSFLRMLGIELSRGLHERNFWILVIVLFLFCLLSMAIYFVWPLSLYYNGGEEGLKIWNHWPFTEYAGVSSILYNGIWGVYFPFLVAAAYAHSIPDDRKNGYADQLIVKEGLGKYISAKLCIGSVLGGVIGAVPIISTMIITFLGIRINPFLQDAAQYYYQEQLDYEMDYSLYWGGTIVKEGASLREWMLTGCISWILLGLIFGLAAGMIGLWTENKLIIYMMPVVGLQLWDVCESLLPLPGNIMSKFYLKSYMASDSFGRLDKYPCLVLLLIILICIAVLLYPKVKDIYREGGR